MRARRIEPGGRGVDPADALDVLAEDANDLVHDVVRDVGVEAERRAHRDRGNRPVDDPVRAGRQRCGRPAQALERRDETLGKGSGRSGRSLWAASIEGDGIPMNCHSAFTEPAA
jgi:hypothetical protein